MKYIITITLILILILVCGGILFLLNLENNEISLLQLIILTLTLLALFFYTLFTYQLHHSTKESIEAIHMPLIFITGAPILKKSLETENSQKALDNSGIFVDNLSKNLALEVIVEPFQAGRWIFDNFNPVTLKPSDADILIKPSSVNVQSDNNFRLASFISIKCRDILNNEYKFLYRVGNGTTPVLEGIFKNNQKLKY